MDNVVDIARWKQDWKRVESILHEAPEMIWAQNASGWTTLMAAAAKGHAPTVQLCLGLAAERAVELAVVTAYEEPKFKAYDLAKLYGKRDCAELLKDPATIERSRQEWEESQREGGARRGASKTTPPSTAGGGSGAAVPLSARSKEYQQQLDMQLKGEDDDADGEVAEVAAILKGDNGDEKSKSSHSNLPTDWGISNHWATPYAAQFVKDYAHCAVTAPSLHRHCAVNAPSL